MLEGGAIMKKLLLCLVVVLSLSIAGCGDGGGIPDGMNRDTYHIAEDTLEVMEMYNDGKMSADECQSRLDEFEAQLNELSIEDDIEKNNNDNVIIAILSAGNRLINEETLIDEVKTMKDLLGR